MPPVIALLSDFGLQDHYVGAMKGAILSVCPEASLVDVLHEVPPQDVAAGALALEAAYRHFAAGTVFVAVVDPGVGSSAGRSRPQPAAGSSSAPTTGCSRRCSRPHPAARAAPPGQPRILSREPLSPVFHGRDLFGPGRRAAWPRGLPLDEVGPVGRGPAAPRRSRPKVRTSGRAGRGAVLHVPTAFGNLTTEPTVEADLAALLAARSRDGLEVALGAPGLPLVRFVLGRGPGRGLRAPSARAAGSRSPFNRGTRRRAGRGRGGRSRGARSPSSSAGVRVRARRRGTAC